MTTPSLRALFQETELAVYPSGSHFPPASVSA
jgi:hypothetical protein